MDLDSRIDRLLEALDEVNDYKPLTGLELLVYLIAKKVDEAELSDMQRGV